MEGIKLLNNKGGISAMTLAEVLITLGIIGVIAAMTIPNLISNYQKTQTIERLKKQYTSLAQAFKQSETDNGPSSYWDYGFGGTLTPRQSFDTYWAPYLIIAKYCSTSAECGYGTTMYKSIAGSNVLTIASPTSRTTVILADGSVLIVMASSGGAVAKHVYLDLNGAKEPNKFGKDLFMFLPDQDHGFMPYRYNLNITAINNDCKVGGYGELCAAKIMKEGWEMADEYPWD